MKYKFTIYSVSGEYQLFEKESDVARFLKDNKWLKLSYSYKNNKFKSELTSHEYINKDGDVCVSYERKIKIVNDGNSYICLDDKGYSYINSYFSDFLILTHKEQKYYNQRWSTVTCCYKLKNKSRRYAKSRNKLRIACDLVHEWEDVQTPPVRKKAHEQVGKCRWDDYYAKSYRYYRNIQKNWKKFRDTQYK